MLVHCACSLPVWFKTQRSYEGVLSQEIEVVEKGLEAREGFEKLWKNSHGLDGELANTNDAEKNQTPIYFSFCSWVFFQFRTPHSTASSLLPYSLTSLRFPDHPRKLFPDPPPKQAVYPELDRTLRIPGFHHISTHNLRRAASSRNIYELFVFWSWEMEQ